MTLDYQSWNQQQEQGEHSYARKMQLNLFLVIKTRGFLRVSRLPSIVMDFESCVNVERKGGSAGKEVKETVLALVQP